MFRFFRVNKNNDRCIEILIRSLDEKPSKEVLQGMLVGYQFMGEKKLPKKPQYTKDDINHQIIVESEEDFPSVYLQEMIEKNLDEVFPEDATLVTFRGKFRDEPTYTTAYYYRQTLVAITIAFLPDIPAKGGPALEIHTYAKRSLINRDFVSKLLGKPKDIGSMLHWKGNGISALLGISTGPVLTLFVFNDSKVNP